jgi:hypothetical protein
MPRPVAELDIVHFVEPQASPFASARQSGSALAAELISECLLPALAVAQNDRAKLARIPFVVTQDLFLTGHGLAE